jgi:hypothetical protein
VETAIAPLAAELDLEETDEPLSGEREELLAQELREAIRRKLEARD